MMQGMPGYPPMPWGYPPPSTHSSPPPQEEKKDDGLADLKELIKKQEEARIAWQKEMIAQKEADAAEAAAKKAKEEEEKKKKEEIAAASKKAKEDAEKKAEEAAKKAKEEHEKKLKEVEEAKAEAEKKQKELEEANTKLTPAPDSTKAPIRFKDAVGRKFSFPFHLCKTWKGMESLIKQAFLHVDVLGDHVHQGHYDLMGPDGEIILPQVWETMIQPDWEISMHMWPMPEDEPEEGKKKKDKLAQDAANLMDPFASLGLGGLGDLGIVDPGKKKPKKSDSKKKKNADGIVNVGSVSASSIPPPPPFPPGLLSDPLGMAGVFPPNIAPVEEKKDKKASAAKGKAKNGTKPSGGLAGWFAGSSASRPSKKDDEKLGLVRRRSGHSGGSGSIKSHSSKADRATCDLM
jgi:chemotaxis protein histidine kinase CheA